MELKLPKLYAIVDASLAPGWSSDRVSEVTRFAQALAEGGAELIQYRNKTGAASEVISGAREIRCSFLSSGKEPTLIMNDRADLCLAADFDGVHLGQEDISVSGARRICRNPLLVGISTHNAEQVKQADQTSADYIAIGPIFATVSKLNPDPCVGLDGLRTARLLTLKPLVAIGGITRANCRQVMAAGADSVAVISDLLQEPKRKCEEFIRLLASA